MNVPNEVGAVDRIFAGYVLFFFVGGIVLLEFLVRYDLKSYPAGFYGIRCLLFLFPAVSMKSPPLLTGRLLYLLALSGSHLGWIRVEKT